MKQLFLMVNDGSVKLIETPAPLCKPGYVLVETLYSVVSAGTERSLASFGSKNLLQKAKERPDQVAKVLEKVNTDGLITTIESVFNRLSEPMPIGYSAVGRVVKTGAGVTDVVPGNIVAMAGQAYHSEVNCVNRNLLVKLPDSFPDVRQASFVALGAIAMQGIRQAKVEPGESVAVIGLGLLGHIAAQILNAYGCDVVAFDVDESKSREAAYIKMFINSQDANAVGIANALTGGYGLDKVIITASANTNQPMDLAAAIVRDRGTICMVGVTHMNIDRRPYYEKEITFTIARSYGPGRYESNYEERGIDYPIGQVRWTENRNMSEFIRLLTTGRIDLGPLITHEIPFENAASAYKMITTNASDEKYVGIVLKYSENEGKFADLIKGPVRKVSPGKKKIGVGMIGAGNFSKATLLPFMNKTGKFRFIGIATTGGVNAPQANAVAPFEYTCTDLHRLLADPSIDLIIVTTRHDTHAEFVIKALEADKHVYVEKPLAISLEQLSRVKTAYEKSKGELFVGFNRRHSSMLKEIKRKLRTGEFPAVYQYTVNAGFIPPYHWTQDEGVGGGRIIGEACHFVDTIQYLTDSSLTDLAITWYEDKNGVYAKADNCLINLGFADGSIANIVYTAMGSPRFPKENLKVFCNGAAVEMTNYLNVEWYLGGKKSTFTLKQQKGFDDEYEFIHDVLNGSVQNNALSDVWINHEKLIAAVGRRRG